MRYLILGAGYVGEFLFEELIARGNHAIIKSRKDLNYADFETLSQYLLSNPVDCVINCSGYTDTKSCENDKDLCWTLNVRYPMIVAVACKVAGVELIHFSTGCVYTGYEKAYTELDATNFGVSAMDSPWYNKSKDAYDNCWGYGLNLRIRYPYSDGKHPKCLLRKISTYETLQDVVNSRTSMHTVADFIDHAIRRGPVSHIGKLNLTNPNPLALSEVAMIVCPHERFKYTTNVPIGSNCILSIAKLQELYPDFELKSERTALLEIV